MTAQEIPEWKEEPFGLTERKKKLLKEARLLLNEVQRTIQPYTKLYERFDDLILEIEDLLGVRQ